MYVSMENLYFNLVNENHVIKQKKKVCSMWTRPSRGDNDCLFMSFGNQMSLSCQLGDFCPVLPKFELLINLLAFNSNNFPFVNYNNSDSCILCDDHLPPNGFGIQDAIC
jgi:hypothetical protein